MFIRYSNETQKWSNVQCFVNLQISYCYTTPQSKKSFQIKTFFARENLIFFTFSKEFFVWLGTSSEDFNEPSLQISNWRALFCKIPIFSSNIIMFNVFEKSPTLFNLCVYTKQIPNHKGFARFWTKKNYVDNANYVI